MQQMRIVLFTLIAFLAFETQAQEFEERTQAVGNIGLNVTNVGTLGRPNIRNTPDGAPSMEYPLNSGIEHLFEGGLWIGAQVDGEIRVSTSAVDAASGYSTGRSGFEFSATREMKERSSLTESEYFSAQAISHQDIEVNITDSNIIVPGTAVPINNHEFPLGAVVKQTSYAWNYSFADFFVIVEYEIENQGTEPWDSVYFGFWSDLVVRNVNVTQDGGAAFFNKGGAGILEDETALYVFQVSGDDVEYTQSYGSSMILGVEWRDQYFHPNNSQSFVDQGLQAPQVNYNFWEYNSSTGLTTFPANDNAKYAVLKQSMGDRIDNYDEKLKLASNKIQLISVGPVPQVEVGEKVKFVMALTCAKQLNDPNAQETKDTELARTQLIEHLSWAKRTYIGEDLNENGLLDEGEDLDDDNELDKYILPEPPREPEVKIIPGEGYVDIYWNDQSVKSIDPISKKRDFEGFKLYRSNAGDEFELDLIGSSNLVAQWDSAGNAVGYNNGFEEIALDEPKNIEGTDYHFYYRMNGLLSGWQYMFILTAFDEGDDELGLEPLESSFTTNSFRVWLGTPPVEDNSDEGKQIGVYPNPYKTTASWDGESSKTNKIYFYNLPRRCSITIYTSSGEFVDAFDHDSESYSGEDIRWFADFGGTPENRVMSGGEHAWDMLSSAGQSVAQGMYIYSVTNQANGETTQGTFSILR